MREHVAGAFDCGTDVKIASRVLVGPVAGGVLFYLGAPPAVASLSRGRRAGSAPLFREWD